MLVTMSRTGECIAVLVLEKWKVGSARIREIYIHTSSCIAVEFTHASCVGLVLLVGRDGMP